MSPDSGVQLAEHNAPVLVLQGVSRVLPKDIEDIPKNILLEVCLPRRWLSTPRGHSFFALQEVTLSLARGEVLAVLAAHRSGKSTLAGVAGGVLSPTSGLVAHASRPLLFGKPTAGFKNTLTVVENLRLRAVLEGLTGDALHQAVEQTLFLCGLTHQDGQILLGNLSPHRIQELAFTLLLQIPAEILVVDDIGRVGAGVARLQSRERFINRLHDCSTLLIGGDINLVRELASRALLLHQGRVYGPFPVEDAITHFATLPDEGWAGEAQASGPLNLYDPMNPPRADASGFAVVPEEYASEEGSFEDDGSVLPDMVLEPVRPDWAPYNTVQWLMANRSEMGCKILLITAPGNCVAAQRGLLALLAPLGAFVDNRAGPVDILACEVNETLPQGVAFDTVICLNGLETAADPVAACRQIADCLVPAGALFVSVPFVFRYREGHDLWRFTPAAVKRLFPCVNFDQAPGHTLVAGQEDNNVLLLEAGAMAKPINRFLARDLPAGAAFAMAPGIVNMMGRMAICGL